MVDVIDPKIGETVLDPAGTGGFLVEAYSHLERSADRAAAPPLQQRTLRGNEGSKAAAVICSRR